MIKAIQVIQEPQLLFDTLILKKETTSLLKEEVNGTGSRMKVETEDLTQRLMFNSK